MAVLSNRTSLIEPLQKNISNRSQTSLYRSDISCVFFVRCMNDAPLKNQNAKSSNFKTDCAAKFSIILRHQNIPFKRSLTMKARRKQSKMLFRPKID